MSPDLDERGRRALDHPRPQMRRSGWTSLDGPWRFAFDDDGSLRERAPRDDEWSREIRVPFAPEAAMSGVHDRGFHQGCWYERRVELAPATEQERVFLHFGAVDYEARVWVNGQLVGSHRGGFTPFSFDITSALVPGGRTDHHGPRDGRPLRSRETSRKTGLGARIRHSIWYPRTTGIWQTVWVERTARTYIECLRWTPHLERWEIGCHIVTGGTPRSDLRARVTLFTGTQVLVDDTYKVIAREIHRRIALSDPGIDDYRNKLLWSPECPNLIEARVELLDGDGQVIDVVESYTALRSVGTQLDRIMLNGRPYHLRLVLDQGYWPESLMTPPSLAALERDIALVKAMGFNGVRKHQKIEDPRFLHLADRMGLLVWEEMPSAYRFTHDSVERVMAEWTEVIDRDYSHPCVVVWVPFNESWGVPDLPEKVTHQHCVQAMYHLTKTLDPTRPVVGNDGWEATTTDIVGIHDYDGSPPRIHDRYGPRADLDDLFRLRRPGGRLLVPEGHPHRGQPIVLTEFGGIAIKDRGPDSEVWGYTLSEDGTDLEERYHLAPRGDPSRAVRGLLLHAAHRHVPGGERPAHRGPPPQVPHRADPAGDPRRAGVARREHAPAARPRAARARSPRGADHPQIPRDV